MKPMTIQQMYDYAKLSVLAYVDLSKYEKDKVVSDVIIREAFSKDPPGNSARIPEALGRQMFDPSKPADISGRWTMLDPYFKTSSATGHSDPASGFAAMLVENPTYGKVLAIAGTEPNGPGQVVQDLEEADIHQIGFWGAARTDRLALQLRAGSARGSGHAGGPAGAANRRISPAGSSLSEPGFGVSQPGGG